MHRALENLIKGNQQRIKAHWVCFGRKDGGLCPGSYKYKRPGSGWDHANMKPSNYVLWAGPACFPSATSTSCGGWQVYKSPRCQVFSALVSQCRNVRVRPKGVV